LLGIVFVNPQLFADVPKLLGHLFGERVNERLGYPADEIPATAHGGPPARILLLDHVQDLVLAKLKMVRIVGLKVVHAEHGAENELGHAAPSRRGELGAYAGSSRR
jgi:hypothetical protein